MIVASAVKKKDLLVFMTVWPYITSTSVKTLGIDYPLTSCIAGVLGGWQVVQLKTGITFHFAFHSVLGRARVTDQISISRSRVLLAFYGCKTYADMFSL